MTKEQSEIFARVKRAIYATHLLVCTAKKTPITESNAKDIFNERYNKWVKENVNGAPLTIKMFWERENKIFQALYDNLSVDTLTDKLNHRVETMATRHKSKVNIYLEYLNQRKSEINTKRNSKAVRISAPTIKRFCELVNDSGLIKRGDESAECFCEKVCKQYKLEYRIRVSKRFTVNDKPKTSDKYLKKVIECILPSIPPDAKNKIELYLTSFKIMYA